MQESFLVFASAVLIFTTAAMLFDLATRRIPNWLNVSSLALALGFHTVTGQLTGLGTALGGFAVGFGILFVLWLIGGGGGGDVKLMAALGAWMGPWWILIVFILSGVYAMLGMGGLFAWRFVAHLCGFSAPVPAAAHVAGGSKQGGPKQGGKQAANQRLIPYAVPVMLAAWSVVAYQLTELLTAA